MSVALISVWSIVAPQLLVVLLTFTERAPDRAAAARALLLRPRSTWTLGPRARQTLSPGRLPSPRSLRLPHAAAQRRLRPTGYDALPGQRCRRVPRWLRRRHRAGGGNQEPMPRNRSPTAPGSHGREFRALTSSTASALSAQTAAAAAPSSTVTVWPRVPTQVSWPSILGSCPDVRATPPCTTTESRGSWGGCGPCSRRPSSSTRARTRPPEAARSRPEAARSPPGVPGPPVTTHPGSPNLDGHAHCGGGGCAQRHCAGGGCAQRLCAGGGCAGRTHANRNSSALGGQAHTHATSWQQAGHHPRRTSGCYSPHPDDARRAVCESKPRRTVGLLTIPRGSHRVARWVCWKDE